MNYMQIREADLSNGPGVRVSIFCSGCEFHCPDCFNSDAWNFNVGKKFAPETLDAILGLSVPTFIKGLSILGGEPLHPRNITTIIELCKAFKEKYPEKTIWIWTGYLYENIVDKQILNYVDVIVDGLFQKELKDYTLKYRGSSNQRVIDVTRSCKEGITVLWES